MQLTLNNNKMEKTPQQMIVFINEFTIREMFMSALQYNREYENYPDLDRRLKIMEEVLEDYKEEIKKVSKSS